jgi:CRISPR/Cas system-associated exonuclease Cas4 (RecB family)
MVNNLIKTLTSKPRNTKLDPKKFRLSIGRAYLQGRTANGFKKKTTFSPSTVGYGHGTCPRYWSIAFDGAEFKETVNAQGVAAMDNGTDAHTRLQKVIEKTGVLKEIEKEIKLVDPPIRGFVDLIIDADGEDIVGEIKTIKDEQYSIRKDTSTGSDSHIVQLLIYMKALNLDEGFLLYENKNTHEIAIVPVVMSEENIDYADYIFNWMKEVRKAWEEKKNIKRPFKEGGKPCNYCPVSAACLERADGRTKIDPLVVRSQC